MSERYDCTDPDGRAEGIPAAAAAVRRGEIVVLPTDTVYGIGCDAFDATAVASVLAAKGRGRDMPPPVLIPTARTAQGLATQVPDYAQRPHGEVLARAADPRAQGPDVAALGPRRDERHRGPARARTTSSPSSCSATSARWRSRAPTRPATRRPAPSTRRRHARRVGRRLPRRRPGQRGESRRRSSTAPGETPVTLRLGAITQADIDRRRARADEPVPEAPDARARADAGARARADARAGPRSSPSGPDADGRPAGRCRWRVGATCPRPRPLGRQPRRQ